MSPVSRSQPRPASASVRSRMARTRGRDTNPELRIRSALHARGFRFRVDASPLVGLRRRADLVFRPVRVAVFVDGCFWHRCPEHWNQPVNNAEFWRQKIGHNVERDRETDQRLTEAGWRVIRIWEHEPIDAAVERVTAAIESRRSGS